MPAQTRSKRQGSPAGRAGAGRRLRVHIENVRSMAPVFWVTPER
jgi:hypothetical protein